MQKWVAAMSEETIIAQCSPTMAGLKTGNLFSERFNNKKEFLNRLRRFNAVLVPRGARLLPLKFEGARVLVYMYRPARLKKDLSNALAVQILSERNYPIEHPEHCLKELIRRLNTNDHFPHEIGLFLGYPPEDVHGFIENKAAGAKYVGTWKVYGDEQRAKDKFAQYKKCTKVYGECFQKQISFDQLIVAVK